MNTLTRFSILIIALLIALSYGGLSRAQSPPAPRPPGGDEGELIELDDVQIHGEIAQPNVAITVSRAEPLFRELTLERTPVEGMNDLDLSGLRGRAAIPVQRIREWKEMLNRPRQ